MIRKYHFFYSTIFSNSLYIKNELLNIFYAYFGLLIKAVEA
ncbi:hypothetical protein HMPREF0648_0442 [Prevotella bivia JCVIHMP010]|nr:hypothetical protein HMPREF0648_0442 [Prevotella bivia JCVIHMP010]